MLGFALADTSGDGRAFRNPDAVLVLLECGDELHALILTRKFKVSRVDGGGGLGEGPCYVPHARDYEGRSRGCGIPHAREMLNLWVGLGL